MKTFDDLVFKPHANICTSGHTQAIMDFGNGYGVSVVTGRAFYTTAMNPYELAVLKDSSICYDTPITDNVVGYNTINDINMLMRRVQEL